MMLVACVLITGTASAREITPNLIVAFFGDHGLTLQSKALLRLVRGEGADMVLHLGDLDYTNNADSFEAHVNEILDEDFPYFAVIGNHDRIAWPAYREIFRDRLQRVPDAKCEGNLGIRATCTYKGLFFVMFTVGIDPTDDGRLADVGDWAENGAFIADSLARSDARWNVCAWHKNQRAMQVGNKEDETGWGLYEACRKAGAIIATTGNTIRLTKGRTIAFVSGIGGQSTRPMRPRSNGREAPGPWWAMTHTRKDGKTAGAVFCTFSPDGNAGRAKCRFKTIESTIRDRFTLIAPPSGG